MTRERKNNHKSNKSNNNEKLWVKMIVSDSVLYLAWYAFLCEKFKSLLTVNLKSWIIWSWQNSTFYSNLESCNEQKNKIHELKLFNFYSTLFYGYVMFIREWNEKKLFSFSLVFFLSSCWNSFLWLNLTFVFIWIYDSTWAFYHEAFLSIGKKCTFEWNLV